MSELKPCPFCGIKPVIGICDSEGNEHPPEYVNDPWSGLGYRLKHEYGPLPCPIATHEGESLGCRIYDSEAEAIAAWNRRATPAPVEPAPDAPKMVLRDDDARDAVIETRWADRAETEGVPYGTY
jgi:hypothetical protein